jgi:hypothetical protein
VGLQAQPLHVIEVMVAIEQQMPVLDAVRPDDEVDAAANGDALTPQRTVVARRLRRGR